MSLTGVSKTALGVARIRAAESRRADRLFDDPYAAAFVAAMPDAYADLESRSEEQRALGVALAGHVAIRTRFYDDYLLDAVTDKRCHQVVLLAAGLDARAYRLPWPAGVQVFELDLPPVLAFKDEVLAGAGATPTSQRLGVDADLTGDWPAALDRAGFVPTAATAWLIEGLLVYLNADDAGRLLDTVGALSAPGSRLSCERGGGSITDLHQRVGVTETTALWQGGLGEDAADWLRRHGWDVETHDVEQVAAGYGRTLSRLLRRGFVTATRR